MNELRKLYKLRMEQAERLMPKMTISDEIESLKEIGLDEDEAIHRLTEESKDVIQAVTLELEPVNYGEY